METIDGTPVIEGRVLQAPDGPLFSSYGPFTAAMLRSVLIAVASIVIPAVIAWLTTGDFTNWPDWVKGLVPLTVLVLRGVMEGLVDKQSTVTS